MFMKEIREKARPLGISPEGMGKTDLIHAIQRAEGYADCYRRGREKCARKECCWWHDCTQPGFNA